jgi:hypothetical protein
MSRLLLRHELFEPVFRGTLVPFSRSQFALSLPKFELCDWSGQRLMGSFLSAA